MQASRPQEKNVKVSKKDEQEHQAQLNAQYNELLKKIVYSDKYDDDKYEYRHIILPKPLYKILWKTHKHLFAKDDSGCLRLLSEREWRALGILQSPGWVHYEIHAPEPHVLLFRRELGFVPPVPQGRALGS